MKTTLAVTKGLLLGAAMIAVAVLTSCGTIPEGGPNPLDRPGDDYCASELHLQNLRAITGNPCL